MTGPLVAAAVLGGIVNALAPRVGAASAQPKIYFLVSSGKALVAVTPTRPLRTPAVALAALIAGPNAAQRAAGDEASFPVGTRTSSLKVNGSMAIVALSGVPLLHLRTIPRLRLIASVTYTLTGFRTIQTVRFSLRQHPWGVYDHSGRVIRDYRRATRAHPWPTACAPGDGCFTP
ncbi:MAG TPA: GerMN domain-containing protein [Gaiellaceae bacterium]|nr:GerMN domain-containing protein [Gaiellaceae bacterium]